MAEYPDLQIHDDWNDRLPKPVTSLADDVAKAGNTPDKTAYSPDMVETSVGAVPADSETAKAAADVYMKESKAPDAPAADESEQSETSGAPAADEKPADEVPAAKSVSRARSNAS